MHRKKISYVILLTLFSLFVKSQGDSLKFVREFYVMPYSIGYTWQGTHNFDFGLQLLLFLDAKRYHDNLALVMTANYSYIHKSSYLTPRTKIKLYREFKKRRLAWITSIGHSYTSINSKFDHRITPEIGISYKRYHLTYGYNIRVSKYSDDVTNNHRVSIRFGIW